MFENIFGNQKVKEILEKSIKAKKTSHSYMFIGPEGIGKKLFAKELAKAILCIKDEKYCDICKSCIEFSSDNNPDFIYIEPEETKIKIEQIRNMQLKVAEKPIISAKKVYIIDNADAMTQEAQNCLLKTLEEPPEYITIILIGSNENNFLTTIKSRCTKIHFEKIPNEDIKKYLKKEYSIDNLDEELLEISNGSIKRAIELKENIETYKTLEKIMEDIDKCDIIDVLNGASELYKSKEKVFTVLENLNIIAMKKARTNAKYANCIKIIEDTKKRLKANSNYDMCIDNLLFNMWGEVN